MGRVMLGMPGPWAKDNYEASDHYTTKIGGVPDWPSEHMGMNPELLKCSLCGAQLCLVLQVYAPLSKDELIIEERTLYVLACPIAKCAANPLSWRALRVQKCQSSNNGGARETGPTGLDISIPDDRNSFIGDDSAEMALENIKSDTDSDIELEALGRALIEATSVASQAKKENQSSKSKTAKKNVKMKHKANEPGRPVLPCFYIYPQEEPSEDIIDNMSTSFSSVRIADGSDGETWEEEKYEYDKALKADRIYLKFKKRVDACPEQCFRYSYGGQPLFAASIVGEPGLCRLCGAAQHYEMQLMPSLLYFLHQAFDNELSHSLKEWNWMTLIIYSCSKSCFHLSSDGKSGSNCWTVSEETFIIQEDDLTNNYAVSTRSC